MKKCTIYYYTLTDEMRKEEKWEWFSENKIKNISFDHIQPDKNNNWLDLTDNDWDTMIPIIDKNFKFNKGSQAIFKTYFPGVPTNRDEWVYDFDKVNLENKMKYFSEIYNQCIHEKKINLSIKWSRDLKKEFERANKSSFSKDLIINAIYRPFTILCQYSEKLLNDVLTQNHYEAFGTEFSLSNKLISVPGVGIDRPFHILGLKYLPHLQITPNGQNIPQYIYSSNMNKIDNITDWGLEQFRAKYEQIPLPPFPKGENQDIGNSALMSENTDFGNPPLSKGVGGFEITKEDIFHYVYAVLHNPEYRKKYEMNLKREFPRIPFYEDFWKWAVWGKKLMDLHINFETVVPFGLDVISINESIPLNPPFPKGESERSEQGDLKIKPKLKANKDDGTIELDNITTIFGIPSEAWEYKLGNRSALEWILDQYKEKKPKDPTIAEKFNTYRFIDYKDKVIDLIKRVTTVSVETVKIVEEMRKQRL